MKVLVIGSRNICDVDLSLYMPSCVDCIISGGAKGVDQLAERYADEHHIPKTIVYPQYEQYGRAAPIKRNEVMVDMADYVLAVWDGVSRGTKYTIAYAEKQGKPVRVVGVSNPAPW